MEGCVTAYVLDLAIINQCQVDQEISYQLKNNHFSTIII